MENKNYKEMIDSIINQAVSEKTFNLEIIERIKELKTSVENLSKENDDLRMKLVEQNKLLNDKVIEYSDIKKRFDELSKKSDDISKREMELNKKDYELEFQRARAGEIKELFSVVFRNPVVKETIHKSGNTGIKDQYGIEGYRNESETKTKEIE